MSIEAVEKIKAKFSEAVEETHRQAGDDTVRVQRDSWFTVLESSQVIAGVRRDGAMFGLLSITNPAPPVMRRPDAAPLAVGEAMMAVRTTDIATVHARLKELGATLLLEPMRSADGKQTELVVYDPDGIRIHVVQRAD